jgi:hypothetical protein
MPRNLISGIARWRFEALVDEVSLPTSSDKEDPVGMRVRLHPVSVWRKMPRMHIALGESHCSAAG